MKIDGYIRFSCVCDCGSDFIAKGSALRSGNTKSCGCLRRDLDEIRRKSMPEWRSCTIDGCSNKARTRKGYRCEKHYYRMRRKGEYSDPVFGARTICSNGYVSLTDHSHPLSMRGGLCYEHRKNLYDHHGGVDLNCHWCNVETTWRGEGLRTVVDHLDNNKQNNEVSNLVPSCHKCNSVRGLFMKWVHDHKDDPFLNELFAKSKYGPDGFTLPPSTPQGGLKL